MTPSITAQDLYQALHQRLDLHWVCNRDKGSEAKLTSKMLTARPALAGYLNLIHPNKVEVLGEEEIRYLDGLDAKSRWETIAHVFAGQPLALIMAGKQSVPRDISEAADEAGVPLFRSSLSSYDLVNFLQYYISRALARSTTLHGVFMEVFTIGVMITGDSGCGKSELALELLNRGHRLIADDAPEFTQISPEIIDGTCPATIQDCLEVRGLGVLNVRQMFGDSAIKLNKFLRLIIHLQVPESEPAVVDRLHGDTSTCEVLDLEIPQITLPVLAGRNMAVITEAAVRDFMLKMKGYDAASAFIERHSQLLRSQANNEWEE